MPPTDAGAGTNGYYNAEDTESEFSEGATELRFVEPLTPQEMVGLRQCCKPPATLGSDLF